MSRRRCKPLQRIVAYLRVYLPSLPFLLPHENKRAHTRARLSATKTKTLLFRVQ